MKNIRLNGEVIPEGELKPKPNVHSIHFDWHFEEDENEEEIRVEYVDHTNDWYCEVAEFEKDGKCYGCVGENKGGERAECWTLEKPKPLYPSPYKQQSL